MGLGVKTTPIPGSYGVWTTIDTDCICHDGAVNMVIWAKGLFYVVS